MKQRLRFLLPAFCTLLLSFFALAPIAMPRAHAASSAGQQAGFLQVAGRSGASVTSSNLIYHNGPVEMTPTVHVIYWGPNWVNNGRPILAARVNNHFFQDAPGTPYFNILTQYTDLNGTHIQNVLNFDFVIDTSTPVSDNNCVGMFPNTTVEDATLQAEINSQIQINHWQVNNNTTFFVYPPPTYFVHAFGSCSEQTFCGYHSAAGNIGSYAVIAFPFDSGCQSLPATPHGDIFSDSLVNITSHELFESVTDPQLNGWFGPGGLSDEIGDKCAYNFSSGTTFLNNGGVDEVQTEWSNATSSCVNHYP